MPTTFDQLSPLGRTGSSCSAKSRFVSSESSMRFMWGRGSRQQYTAELITPTFRQAGLPFPERVVLQRTRT